MRDVQSILSIILLIYALFGCKTTRNLPTDSSLQSDTQTSITIEEIDSTLNQTEADQTGDTTFLYEGELRGIVVDSEMYSGETFNDWPVSIGRIFEDIAGANYNVVLWDLGKKNVSSYLNSENTDKDEGEPDPLIHAIREAQEKGLKLYTIIDFNEFISLCTNTNDSIDFDLSFIPFIKTSMKGKINFFIKKYDLDGLCFDFTGFSKEKFSKIRSDDDIALKTISYEKRFDMVLSDLIEDVLVESLLIKPYLANSLILDANKESGYAGICLNERIVDFIIPKFDIDLMYASQEFKTFTNKEWVESDTVKAIYPWFFINETGAVIDTLVLEKTMDSLELAGLVIGLTDTSNTSPGALKLSFQYPEEKILPEHLKKISPNEVFGLDLSSFFIENREIRINRYSLDDKVKIPDSKGHIGFIGPEMDTLQFEAGGKSLVLPTTYWALPYRYRVLPDTSVIRDHPWVEFRRMPTKITEDSVYHLLCRTHYPSKAWINGNAVKVYKTGVFFDKIELKEGTNRIRASILTHDSLSVFYEREFVYREVDKKRNPLPLWIDKRSVRPDMNLELLQEDRIQVSFQGSLGQEGIITMEPGSRRFACSREDFEDYSQYQTDIPLKQFETGISYQVIIKLKSSEDTLKNISYVYTLPDTIKIRTPEEFPLIKVVEENSRLTYNLGPVRLGGPIRAEIGPGVVMKANGKLGENFRVRLNQIESGIIHQSNIEVLPEETIQSSYYITNISCSPGREGDIVSIPYSEPIPYAVYPDPDQNKIIVTLYGAKTSSTWISHRRGRKVIDKITWRQPMAETYEVHVNLKTSKIWGYDIHPDGKRLILTVRYPPLIDLKENKPLSGIKIAIEAGHGGRSTGAIGLSGLLEKEINLDLALKLGDICEKMGADILQVRRQDSTMSLLDKRKMVLDSDADILISIHANAAGTRRGYLRVPGTSTYYHNPFWAPLAEYIYDRLLELDLAEFGVVGSFNYTVIRVSKMPSILVEQAFMTHAEDEEKLADPEFRQAMAQKIYEGLIDYLSSMKNE